MPKLVVCLFISTIVIGAFSGVHGSSFYKQQPILTIKMENGQEIDCIDFYKQPAFINSSTKNHITKEKLISLQSEGEESEEPNISGLKNGCPFETVPILRSLNVQKPSIIQPNSAEHCLASIITTGHDRQFKAASGSITLYQPKVFDNSQWSSARIKLSNGPESIEAGVLVNPTFYNNSDLHFYLKYTIGPQECYNYQCQGFVQVSKDMFPGNHPSRYMHIGDKKYLFWTISIDQHKDDKNWWVSVYPMKTPVGYWPNKLFKSLAGAATSIEWAGEINDPGLVGVARPYMGSGLKARPDITKSAAFFQLSADHQNLIPDDTQVLMGCQDYTIVDGGNSTIPEWGRIFYYGGPNENLV